VTDSIKACAKSREQIVEEMTVLLGDRVTVRMLNSYTSEAQEQHRWPMQFTRAFCYVVEDWSLLQCVVERSGFLLITQDEAALLELGAEYLRQKRANERLQMLEKRLGGLEL
jgi:hypothetical protein